jgi:fucose permease
MIPRRVRIRFDLLALMCLLGSLGAPLVGPLRETLQARLGLSRLQLGAGVFAMGLSAGVAGILLVRWLGLRVSRTAWVRVGTSLVVLGMGLLAAGAWRGSGLALAAGWFVLLLGGTFARMANAVVMDLWHASPRRGLILLHATNAVGKVLAPALVFLVGASLARNGLVFALLAALVLADMLFWPRAEVRALGDGERRDAAGDPADDAARGGRALFWAAASMLGIVAGAEAGVISILGSFITRLRTSPFPALDQPEWAAAVLAVAQMGIVTGRFIFFRLATRLSERRILFTCLAFAVFVFPAVLLESPAAYVPSLFLLCVAFSATWPACFALTAARYRVRRNAYTMACTLFTLCGVNAAILLASAIGNTDAGLAPAIVLSALTILLPGAFVAAFYPATPTE